MTEKIRKLKKDLGEMLRLESELKNIDKDSSLNLALAFGRACDYVIEEIRCEANRLRGLIKEAKEEAIVRKLRARAEPSDRMKIKIAMLILSKGGTNFTDSDVCVLSKEEKETFKWMIDHEQIYKIIPIAKRHFWVVREESFASFGSRSFTGSSAGKGL